MKKILKIFVYGLTLLAVGMVSAQSTELQKLIGSDSVVSDQFGYDVAIDGTRAIIGTYANDTAYIFDWNGSAWVETQILTPSDGISGDRFGNYVDIDGDRAIVGAYENDGVASAAGAAYIYEWNGSTWTEVQKITSSDAASGDYFGWAVAISGDRAAVTATRDDDQGASSGSIYFFEWNGSAWVEVDKIVPSAVGFNHRFGESVAMEGTRVIAGNRSDTENGTQSGAVYVFEWNGSAWSETQKLTASDGAASDYLGYSVGISGDRIVAGAYYKNGSTEFLHTGAAYVYDWNGSSWVQSQKLTANDLTYWEQFGYSVGIYGDRIVVGASNDDENGGGSGSAYIFEWDGNSWVQSEKLISSNIEGNDNLGWASAISADYVIVGARSGDNDSNIDTGAAYIFIPGGIPDVFCTSSALSSLSNPLPDLIYWDWSGNNPYTANTTGTAVAVLVAPAETVLTSAEITGVDGNAEPGMVYFDEQTGELYIADAGGNLQDPLNVTSNAVASPNASVAEVGEVYFNTTTGEITVCETAGTLDTPSDPSASCVTQ